MKVSTAEKLPTTPKRAPKEAVGSAQSHSLSEDSRMTSLHDLNDKLLRQVAGLRSDRVTLTNKVAQLEEELSAVSYSLVSCLKFSLLFVYIYVKVGD